MAKAEIRITPEGTAMWTNVRKADRKYGKHGLSLKLDKDDGGPNDKLAAELNKMHKDAGGAGKRNPAKDGAKMRNGDDEPYEGMADKWVLKFGSKYAPKVIDASKKIVPPSVDVFGGDQVKVAFTVYKYDEGITLKLQVIMLLRKGGGGEGGTAAIDAFDAVEGEDLYVAPEHGAEDLTDAADAADDDGGDF